ncbi:MAG: molybdenum cofactor biosynthesis protein MoaE, partial [Candidatus Parcubacteria bacterium]|nr:molybdenum cofactor biosynthesis protein MoaE [Candidatus Parcubacteria bacterium]
KTKTAGSVVLHYAVVRGQNDKTVTASVEFQPVKDKNDVKDELHSITDDIRSKFKVDDVLIIRAMGKLNVGDVMSLVAASSPHREAVFDACRYGVEKLKAMKTIRKKETFI